MKIGLLFALIVGLLVLYIYYRYRSKSVLRSEQQQALLDSEFEHIALYHFSTCPYCLRVRAFIKRQQLQLECCDIEKNKDHYTALKEGAGKTQVPCLAIHPSTHNHLKQTQWMFESADIIKYLEARIQHHCADHL